MAMSINQLMRNEGAALYYSKAWLDTIESHLKWLLSRPSNQLVQVDPHDAYKYEADLTGLLSAYGVSREYHYVVMRMNDLTSPRDYSSDLLRLIVPDRSVVEGLRSVFQTVSKKIN